MKTLDAALAYLARGLSIIPVNPDQDKKPYRGFSWTPFQKKLPTEEDLRAWYKKYPNMMIAGVTGKLSDLTVIDIDTDAGREAISPHLPECLETWTTSTPRGGTHIFFKHDEEIPTRSGIIPGIDTRSEGGYIILPPSVNGSNKSYRWAIPPDECELQPMPDACKSFLIKNINTYKRSVNCDIDKSQPSQQSPIVTLNFSKGKRNDSFFTVAHSLLKGGMPSYNAMYLLVELNKACKTPLPLSEVQTIFKSAEQRFLRCERNIQGEVRDFVSVTSGDFSVTSVYEAVTSVTPEEKAAVRKALDRLSKGDSRIIEHVGNKNGWYRLIDNNIEVMDFLNAPTEEFKITLPLGVSNLCKLYPGNIIIVAGAKSAGKTAFLLNLAKLNIFRWPIDYLNSEFGDTELRLRLEAHPDITLKKWAEGIRFISRSRDWWDLIQPENKITIIDYLEPDEDKLYMVGSFIRKIHEKMQGRGLCFIGLQKPTGRDLGRGGNFSMDKARLYLSLDYSQETGTNQIKIIDAKAWRGENPRGKTRDYKVHDGATYQPVSDWHL